jgi:hypothetical protein
MSLADKTVSESFKSIVRVDDNTNGIDTSLESLTDGEGTKSSISLSDDQMLVKPQNDDTTSVFNVQTKSGTSLLTVDSTNSAVKGTNSQYMNTQYAHFGVGATDAIWATSSANTHYAIPFTNCASAFLTAIASLAIGTGTDPDTSLTLSTTSHDILQCYWYVPDSITIDAVQWWVAGDAATGDTVRGHLMSYDVVTTAGATSGDLSNGAVVASSSDITSAGYEQAYYNSMTINSANVDAGKVVLFAFRADSVNSDYTINATVKYHLR